jgi:hypothetical protein
MELERATRRIMWLRTMMTAMQMFRTTNLSIITRRRSTTRDKQPNSDPKTTNNVDMNYGRETRLHNRTPTYLNIQTGRLLLWMTVFEGNDYGGKWAILDEYGPSTIRVIAVNVSARGQNGPDPDTVWLVRGSDGEFSVDEFVTILDNIGVATLVHDATVVIRDNITALE